MNCIISTMFGLAMVAATFSTMTVSKQEHDVLRKKLSLEVANIYDKIAIERRNYYIQGLILGLVISYLVSDLFFKQINKFHKVTLVLSITTLVSVVYYFLMPKSDYMLNHLKTPEQIKAWLKIYKTMKNRYFWGFLIGSLSAIPIGLAMC
jgi:uncharacterized protein YacL